MSESKVVKRECDLCGKKKEHQEDPPFIGGGIPFVGWCRINIRHDCHSQRVIDTCSIGCAILWLQKEKEMTATKLPSEKWEMNDELV